MCDRVKKNLGSVILSVIVLLVSVTLIVINFKNASFFSADIIDIITIVFGFFITLFITEGFKGKRRRNDCIEHIIIEIETFISKDENFMIGKSTLILQASCANKIKYLKDAKFPDIKEEIEFISNNFDTIRDLYSNHSKSKEELDTVKIDIDKNRTNIVDKCNKIRIGLYSK